jgi:hypothetical protein
MKQLVSIAPVQVGLVILITSELLSNWVIHVHCHHPALAPAKGTDTPRRCRAELGTTLFGIF